MRLQAVAARQKEHHHAVGFGQANAPAQGRGTPSSAARCPIDKATSSRLTSRRTLAMGCTSPFWPGTAAASRSMGSVVSVCCNGMFWQRTVMGSGGGGRCGQGRCAVTSLTPQRGGRNRPLNTGVQRSDLQTPLSPGQAGLQASSTPTRYLVRKDAQDQASGMALPGM